jgi:5-methylcytosine-specific restriction endonuclease McrA
MTDTQGRRRAYRFKSQWRTTTRTQVLARTGGCCALCGHTGSDGRGKGLQMAHLTPHGQGGRDDASNLVPLCGPCHRRFDAGRKRPGR